MVLIRCQECYISNIVMLTKYTSHNSNKKVAIANRLHVSSAHKGTTVYFQGEVSQGGSIWDSGGGG